MTVELFEPLTKPTAAQLNAIGDSQETLTAIFPGVASVALAAHGATGGQVFGFIHVHRWLLYDSTGELVDASGVNDPVSLPDPDLSTEIGVLDLDSVSWLAGGLFYLVTGCTTVWEAVAPPYA